MHIPDNYLSPQTCAVMGAIMIPVWTVAVKKVKEEVTAKKVPLLGISAAFAFLLMMFNVPIPGGTSAHAVGATLIAILLGPFSATIAVSIALLIQALLFGDGGVLSFGANCFNMAFVIPFAGYFIYTNLKKIWKNEKAEYVIAFIAGYIAINLAALFAAVEFGIQPILFKDAAGLPLYCPYGLSVSIPAMLISHLIAGIVEGVVTSGVLLYVRRVSPEIIHADSGKKTNFKPMYILLAAMIILTPIGLIASGTAWGEWAADELKDKISAVPANIEKGFRLSAPLQDYNLTVPSLTNVTVPSGVAKTLNMDPKTSLSDIIGYLISAVAGAALLLIIFRILSSILKKGKEPAKNE
jgi:cobalt/nickel transport system permease protein